jgi:hypothetical protein
MGTRYAHNLIRFYFVNNIILVLLRTNTDICMTVCLIKLGYDLFSRSSYNIIRIIKNFVCVCDE